MPSAQTLMNTSEEMIAAYRRRAEELRSLAARIRDQVRRDFILTIATNYERFADQLENPEPK